MTDTTNAPVFTENGIRLPGGFCRGIFATGFDIKFVCRHCHQILRDPVQSQCGHRFCRSCRDEILVTNDSIQCPICIEDQIEDHEIGTLALNEMFPDNAVRREMLNMQASCVFPGCNWKGRFKEYETHEKNCQFKQLACSKCRLPFTEGQLENHRANVCPERIVQCTHCREDVIFSKLQEHYDQCSQFPKTCQHCGQNNIKQDQMSIHQEQVCPKRLFVCPVGCTDKFQLDKFIEHLAPGVETHLAWTIQKLTLLELSIKENIRNYLPQSELVHFMEEIKKMEEKVLVVERQLQQVLQNRSSGAAASGDMSSEMTAKASLKLIEPILGVIHNEVDRAIHALQTLEGHYRQQQAQLDEIETQFRIQQQQLQLKDAAIADLEMRLAAQEMARYDGTILWKVSGFEGKKRDAISGQTTSLYSPAFYSGPCGYKMCARIYPNGDGIGKGTHISLFFVIMRGHFDALLPWPFSQKVTLMMIDQNHKEHIVDAFKPDPTSSSFKRPTTEMNIASGCPLFLPLEKLHNRLHGYLRDDTLFVKILVDTEGLDRYTEMNPSRFTSNYLP